MAQEGALWSSVVIRFCATLVRSNFVNAWANFVNAVLDVGTKNIVRLPI